MNIQPSFCWSCEISPSGDGSGKLDDGRAVVAAGIRRQLVQGREPPLLVPERGPVVILRAAGKHQELNSLKAKARWLVRGRDVITQMIRPYGFCPMMASI